MPPMILPALTTAPEAVTTPRLAPFIEIASPFALTLPITLPSASTMAEPSGIMAPMTLPEESMTVLP